MEWNLTNIEHLLGLIPKTDVTRRGFVMTTLAAGFALAVQPVSAETITTDAEGLTLGEVNIPTRDGHIPAYRAMRSEEHTSELQSRLHLVCRLLLEKKKKKKHIMIVLPR